MEFAKLALQEHVSVDKLISFHYFEYASGYAFDGEEHDFWEFLYVDKGETEVRADDRIYELKQGQLIFHKPNEFHTVRVHEQHKPPNLVVISFECPSPAMAMLEDRVFALEDKEKKLLSVIVKEGYQCFAPPFDDPSSHTLIRQENAPFAGEQLIKAYLEVLLISLIRLIKHPDSLFGKTGTPLQLESNSEADVVNGIVEYMKNHISEPLELDKLSKRFHLGRSRLREVFHKHTSMGLLEYFKHLRIEFVKSAIRENRCNFTEIAERLGYASIHYFSKDFRKMTGMSPSEYAKSVTSRIPTSKH